MESADATMTNAGETGVPVRLEGKVKGMVFCWVLGLGSLVAWNSMVTIGDYYYEVFPHYHPSRVLTLVYLPFAIGTMAILSYHESRVDTRKRNIVGYTLFTLSTLFLIVGPEQIALGNLLILFLFGGTFSGVALGWLWIIGNGKFERAVIAREGN